MLGINFIKLKISIDEIINELANFILLICNLNYLKIKSDLKPNIIFKDILKNQKVIIIANGPSTHTYNLRELKGETLFFMNRGFLHKDYAYLKPQYHFIIDEKLNNGIWPITFIDEIFNLNPNVKLFLNLKWSKNKKFYSYKKKYVDRIFWIDTRLFFTKFNSNQKINLTKLTYGNAVSGAAFSSAVYMGANDISFIGQDLNGLCYDILNKDSHFYGYNKENDLKSIVDITDDLFSMSSSIRSWSHMIRFAKNNNLEIKNLSQSHLLDLILKYHYF